MEPVDRGAARSGAGLHRENWPEVGVPSRPRDSTRWGTSERAKNKWQRTSGSLPAISGESVKGSYPLSHSGARRKPRADAGAGATGFGVTRSAGFALPRDAGRRPALQAVPAIQRDGVLPSAQKQMAANLWFAADDFGGMCERGDSPLSQSVTTNRNSPKCAEGAQGSFDCGAKRRRFGRGVHPPRDLTWYRYPDQMPPFRTASSRR